MQMRKSQRPIDFFIPIEHRQLNQKAFIDSPKKNKAAFGGNRSGKTRSGAYAVIRRCLDIPGTDAWGATWADLSTPIQQAEYNKLLPKNNSVLYARFTEQRGFSNRIILFKNGSKIRFKTYDQGWESFQGAAKDIIHLDEEPPQEIVNECKARLIDKNGILIRTLTPLNGITYTYDEMIMNQNNDPEIEYFFFNSKFNPHINQQARERIINSFAEKEAEVRETGHFLNLTTGQVYYTFSEDNIIETFEYMPNRPLEIDCDFNVDLMSWNIGQEHQMKDYIFDFVELERHANTEMMCQLIKNKYPQHKGGFIFYGDISGNQRHPEASRTNWAIIRDEFPNAEIQYQNIRNIKDRVDAVNARLKNKADIINIYITPNCKRLLKDLRRVTWELLLNKNKDEVKRELLTHSSDGLSYRLFWKYPLTGKTTSYQW